MARRGCPRKSEWIGCDERVFGKETVVKERGGQVLHGVDEQDILFRSVLITWRRHHHARANLDMRRRIDSMGGLPFAICEGDCSIAVQRHADIFSDSTSCFIVVTRAAPCATLQSRGKKPLRWPFLAYGDRLGRFKRRRSLVVSPNQSCSYRIKARRVCLINATIFTLVSLSPVVIDKLSSQSTIPATHVLPQNALSRVAG